MSVTYDFIFLLAIAKARDKIVFSSLCEQATEQNLIIQANLKSLHGIGIFISSFSGMGVLEFCIIQVRVGNAHTIHNNDIKQIQNSVNDICYNYYLSLYINYNAFTLHTIRTILALITRQQVWIMFKIPNLCLDVCIVFNYKL